MAADVNSLIVKVVSEGIDATTKSLNNLTDASDKAEKSTQKLGNTNRSSSDGTKEAVSAVERLLQKYQTQVDLLGANVQASNAYTAALKGGNSAHVAAAAFLGAEVDAYKALGKAQIEATAYNKALDKSYEQLSKQADAYYASQQRLAASAKAMNDAGYRAQEYKKLAETQAEAIRMNNAFDASLRRQQARIEAVDIERHNASVRQYSQAHAEAIRMNAAFDAQVRSTTGSIRTNNTAMQEAHALARGLSGSFGALWVTYGNFAGMAVGLAIGQSLKSIVSVGKDVEHTLEGIRVKGEETTESIQKMRESIAELGKGVYGPKEVAGAFETLVLAGLSAKQAMSGISDALNLATVGGTSIEKSAYTIVQVGTALGYSAESYGRIADVIAKTAAVSMSSVETLSEAFKSASVVGKLYGVTLVDIGTSLAALSQLGIQGSAAGTSLKNFYKELSSNADKVKDTLKGMKLVPEDFKDAEGNFLGVLEVVEKLAGGLTNLTANQQKLAIANLSNERGMKTAVELLDMYNQKVKDAGGSTSDYANVLSELRTRIEESYGFATVGAVQMSLTVESQFKSVANTLQTVFLGAFQKVSPEITNVASRLKAAFESPEFIGAVEGIATGFSKMAVAIAENLPLITKFIEGMIAFKIVSSVIGLLVSAAQAMVALKAAMDLGRISAIAFQASLGALGVALLAAGAAYVYFTNQRDASNLSTTQQNAIKYSEDYSAALDKEATRMREQLRLMKEGKTSREAETQAIYNQQIALAKLQGDKAKKEAEDRLEKAGMNVTLKDLQISEQIVARGGMMTSKVKEFREAQAAMAETNRKVDTSYQKVIDSIKETMQVAKELEQERKRQADNEPKPKTGTGTVEKPEKEKAIGLTAITAELKAIALLRDTQLNADSEMIASIRERYKLEKEGVVDTQQSIEAALRDKLKIQKTMYFYEQEAILASMALSGRSVEEKNTLLSKLSDSTKRYRDATSDLNIELLKNSSLIETVIKKDLDDSQKASDKQVENTIRRTASIKAEVDAYNKLPAAIKAAGVTDKQMADAVSQAKIDALDAAIEKELKEQLVNERTIAQYKEQKEALIGLRDTQSQREAQQATNKVIQDYNTAWKQANKQIGDDLASAIIDGGGKGWKKLIRDMEIGFAKTVLQPILAPISAGIASLTTTVGASSPGAVAGTASGAVGLAQSAMNAYSLISKGFQGIETSVTSMAQGVLNHFGVTTQYAGSGLPSTTALGVGSIASTAAGIGGGLLLGNSISGQYGSSGTVAAGTAVGAIVGSIVPVLGTALGSFLGGTVGGTLNRAFGMGSKDITKQGISGTIAESGVTGQSYQNWQQSGGWFRSDKSGTEKQDLGTDVINTFASGLTSLKATSTDFAKNLNVSADALNNYSKTFDITLTNDTAANQKAITDFFTTIGDDMANKLVPNLSDFAKSGETASGTLQRLSETFAATNQIAQLLGNDMSKVFGGLGLESAKARQYLVDLAGGISALNTQVTFYATNFLTDAEKIAPVQKAVTAALAEMGYSSVKTTEQFKAVVNGLDLSTQAGAQTFESLMQLAPAFKQVVDYTESLIDTTTTLKDATTGLTKAQQDAIDMANKQASASYATLQSSVQAEKDAAKAAYDAQVAILNAQISSAEVANKLISDLSSALQSTVDSLKSSTPVTMMGRGAAQQQISDALDTALKTGKLPTAESLKDALSTITKPSDSMYSSYAEYIKDQGITAGKVGQLNDLTKTAKTVSDKQLDALKDQLSTAKKAYDATVQGFDDLLSMAQQQLDVLNGISTLALSMTEALAGFNTSIVAALAAKNSGAATSGGLTAPVEAKSATEEEIKKLYQSILGREGEASGVEFWMKSGLSSTGVAQGFYSSAEYLASHPNAASYHGSNANGADSVPFDGYISKLHKGEMILPAKQAQGVVQGSDISELSTAITKSNADSLEVISAMQSDIRKLYKRILDMSPNGQSLQTTAGPA